MLVSPAGTVMTCPKRCPQLVSVPQHEKSLTPVGELIVPAIAVDMAHTCIATNAMVANNQLQGRVNLRKRSQELLMQNVASNARVALLICPMNSPNTDPPLQAAVGFVPMTIVASLVRNCTLQPEWRSRFRCIVSPKRYGPDRQSRIVRTKSIVNAQLLAVSRDDAGDAAQGALLHAVRARTLCLRGIMVSNDASTASSTDT